jgi:hypothetical protein
MDLTPMHPCPEQKINNYQFSIINLRDETDTKESYFKMYDYMVEYLKELILFNNKFKKWYKVQSPELFKRLSQIYNLVNIYYNYDNVMLNRSDICDILNQIKSKFDENPQIKIESIVNEYSSKFNDKIKSIISDQTLKFVDNSELIKKKQLSVYDMFYDIVKSVYKKQSIIDYHDYISKMQIDIINKIELFTESSSYDYTGYVFDYNKDNIKNEIESTQRKILKYIYSKNILHFDNYLHHLRNIYLGIRFYLQKGYMNKRFIKNDVSEYNKFYCCVKEVNIKEVNINEVNIKETNSSEQVILGMIVNKYKDNKTNEFLQEHIFISNNIKMQIFSESNSDKKKQLSIPLHSYASNLLPISKVIYCNPLPSMFKIFRTADANGILKLNILSNEEITEIKNKQIICFKFPPTISINITKELQDYHLL